MNKDDGTYEGQLDSQNLQNKESKICLDCSLLHPEIGCMADEFPELVDECCLMPKFICGYVNRHNPSEIKL